jgi:hypothetical protein
MLESPAFRALSFAGHKFLARLEIEHLHHAGRENGRLIVTYDQFAEWMHLSPEIIRKRLDYWTLILARPEVLRQRAQTAHANIHANSGVIWAMSAYFCRC